MALKTFSGGVHPADSKKLTNRVAIVEPALPERVLIPLRQSLGAPAKPLVKVGDKVLAGQMIGEPAGFVSVPVHASISGQVTALGRFPHPLGGEDTAIVIEGDGRDAWHESVAPRDDVESLAPKEIVEIIRQAGIVGLGGAAFPTHVKLSPPDSKPIDTAILNGAECEPWLTADHRLMLERPGEVLKGFQLMMRALGCSRGIVGIESNKPDAVESMRSAVPKGAGIDVRMLQVKYPQGAEKQLIDALLRRKVPAGGLPMDVAVVVQNVGTAFAVYEACYLGRPLTHRVVTVTGRPVRQPSNFMPRIGTLVSSLVEQAGGLEGEVAKVISGGPMMGMAQFSTEIPVIKGMSGVLFLGPGELDLKPPDPCIRCGHCVHACPMKLLPTTIEKYVMAGKFADAVEIGLNDCIECGSCAYVCPSRRRLVHNFKFGKYISAQHRRKAAEQSAKEKGS
ncbi:MAG: electron transport complex subunit RsxC [Candidatus Eisenbacteria bacterium]|nr:electron transport complex subunit RsxC [Candidatus Eisenbacteria bacterium]